MTVVALQGFAAGESVSAYPFAVGELWVRQMRQAPPMAPTLNGAASATGVWNPDLPDNTEFLVVGETSLVAKQVLNAVTQGGSVPLVPAV